MRGRIRGGLTPYTPSRETLAATSCRPNSEVLAVRVVLAHPHVSFHPCTCGFCRGAAALIGYEHVKVATEMTTRRRRSIDYFLYTDAQLHWIAASTHLLLCCASSGNDDL
jgi:hypothetical protein